MQRSINNNQTCQHTPLRHGIHYFEFLISSKRAVDEWFEALEGIYTQTASSGATIKLLIDVRSSGLLPMTYINHVGRQWLKTHPVHQDIRIAVLHTSGFPVSVAQNFTRVIGTSSKHHVQFFSAKQKTDTMAWLSGKNLI